MGYFLSLKGVNFRSCILEITLRNSRNTVRLIHTGAKQEINNCISYLCITYVEIVEANSRKIVLRLWGSDKGIVIRYAI